MNISGIRTSSVFYDYNIIKNQELRSQQIQENKAAESGQKNQEQQEQNTVASVRADKPDNGAAEFAKRYQPDATYELKGADSDINSLDVEKAISDMQKDEVLQQYQFFVGESEASERLMETRKNENFSL